MPTSQTFADSKLNYSAPQEPVVISSTEEILDDLRQGRMVIIMDDEDRENEGDLLIASQFVTPAVINFMAREGCGLICMTLTREKAEALDLSPMVSNNQTPHMTNFTVSF